MAVDSKAKRFSMLNFSAGGLLPDPDAIISQADRQHRLDLYSGILALPGLAAIVNPTRHKYGRGEIYELTWDADNAGNATLWLDGVRAPLLRGVIHRAETVPSAANVPTANYDITLETRLGADVLGGALANRSATAAEMAFPYYSLGTSGHGERSTIRCLEFKVANAGAGGAGVTAFYVLQP